jgi:hypothetical protein
MKKITPKRINDMEITHGLEVIAVGRDMFAKTASFMAGTIHIRCGRTQGGQWSLGYYPDSIERVWTMNWTRFRGRKKMLAFLKIVLKIDGFNNFVPIKEWCERWFVEDESMEFTTAMMKTIREQTGCDQLWLEFDHWNLAELSDEGQYWTGNMGEDTEPWTTESECNCPASTDPNIHMHVPDCPVNKTLANVPEVQK